MGCTVTEVLAPNGKPSKLFRDLLKHTGNQQDALRLYLKAKTSEVKNQNKRIKPGVSELFESNPELANEVYESLGYKTKADVILPIGTSGSGKSTFIKSLSQENLVVIEPDAMRVEFTGNINNKSKDKEIYEEAANRAIQAIKQDKQVVFDTTNLTKDKRLPFIEAVKKAIPNANIQYKLMELNPDLAKQRIKAQLERGENRAAVSDETIDRHAASYKQMLEDIKNEPINNFEITPQQKQQAQQQYSQYLDTIFPDSKVKDIVYRGDGDSLNKAINSTFGTGYYFTPKKSYAENFAEIAASKDKGHGLYIALLNLKNPLIYNETLKNYKIERSRSGKAKDKYKKYALNKLKNNENIPFLSDLVNNENTTPLYSYKDGKYFTSRGREVSIEEIKQNINLQVARSADDNISVTTEKSDLENINKKLTGSNDGVVVNIQEKYEDIKKEYVVFESKQIHILGSKQDIEAFKQFVNSIDSVSQTLDENGEPLVQDILPENENNDSLYHQRDREEDDYYAEQLSKAAPAQKTAYEKIKNIDSTVERRWNPEKENKDGSKGGFEYVNLKTGEIYASTHEWIDEHYKEDTKESFKETDNSKYEHNREWGHEMDDILSGIILGENKEKVKKRMMSGLLERNSHREIQYDEVLMTDEAFNESYEAFDLFVKDQHAKGNIILTQKKLFNSEKKIAGTTDIMVVKPTGHVVIYDLKTSYKPTLGSYEHTSGDGTTFVVSYNKGFKVPTQLRHQRQQTIYSAMGQSQGLDVRGTNILAMHIAKNSGKEGKEGVNPSTIMKVNPEFIVDGQVMLNEERHILSSIMEIHTQFSTDKDSGIDYSLNNKDEYMKKMDKVKTIIQQRIDKLQHTSDSAKKQNNLARLESLLRKLKTTETFEATRMFIDDTNDLFMDEKNGYSIRFKRVYKNLKSASDMSSRDIKNKITELNAYYSIADMYLEMLEEYRTELLSDENADNIDEGSTLDQLNKIFLAASEIKSVYKKSVIPLIGLKLAEQRSEKDAAAVDIYVQARQKRITDQLDKLKKKEPSRIVRMKISYLEYEFKNLSRQTATDAEAITKMLQDGDMVDVHWIDYMLSPMISSDNIPLALFAKSYKDALEEGRQKSIEFGRNAVDAYLEFKKATGKSDMDVAKFNEGLYERISMWNGKEMVDKMALVQELDITKHAKALNEAYKAKEEINKKDGWHKANAFMESWFRNNMEIVSAEEIKEILQAQKQQMDKVSYQEWLAEIGYDKSFSTEVELGKEPLEEYAKEIEKKLLSNPSQIIKWSYKNPLLIPNKKLYTNKNYTKLMTDNSSEGKAKRKYFKFIRDNYLKLQERVPNSRQMGYVLPSIDKTTGDRLREGNIKGAAKYKGKELFGVISADYEIYGEGVNKTIPVYFTQHMDADQVSVNLIQSLIRYENMINRYESATDVHETGVALLNVFKDTKFLDTNSKGEPYANRIAKKAGVNLPQKKNKEATAVKYLSETIDSLLYGQTEIEQVDNIPLVGEVRWNKVATALTRFASITQIGGTKALLYVANSLVANANMAIEAASAKFYSTKDMTKAKAKYFIHITDFMNDWGKPVNRSFLGQLADAYDAIQGDFTDKLGRKVTNNVFKRLFSSDTWYVGQYAGEHEAQVTSLLASMIHKKIQTSKGEISLIDAYELNDKGILSLKKGIKLKGNITKNGLVDKDLMNSLHATNKYLHGVYNSFDKALAERYAAGKLLMLYRKFFMPGIKRRFVKTKYDQEMGGIVEGTSRTFFRLLTTEVGELKNYLVKNENNLTTEEKQNIQRAIRDYAIITTLLALTMILKSAFKDDDDDDKALAYATYWAMRLRSEMMLYYNPADLARIFSVPTVSMTVIQKSYRVIKQGLLVWDEEDMYYKRDAGFAKKGDNKTWIALQKLFGRNGQTFHPEEAVKILDIYD